MVLCLPLPTTEGLERAVDNSSSILMQSALSGAAVPATLGHALRVVVDVSTIKLSTSFLRPQAVACPV